MTRATLEERMNALEKQVAALQAQVQKLIHPKDWRNVVGMFDDDEVMKRIDEAGRKIREEDRRKTMPKPSKSKRRTHS
jgi:regulator of replication initiation timing